MRLVHRRRGLLAAEMARTLIRSAPRLNCSRTASRNPSAPEASTTAPYTPE